MKRILLSLAALFALVLTTQAQKLDVGVQSAIVYQTLNQANDTGTLNDIAPGFQNAVGNLSFGAELFEGGNVNVDVFISSKHHNETYGYQGYFQLSQLPSWMELGAFGDFYDKHLSVRAGQMTLNFGDGYLYRSINGDVYNNELVGNPVAMAGLTALGMEATLAAGPFELMGGFSNGTTKGDISEGKGLALHTKATVKPLGEKARLSLSYYQVDHSANGTGYPSGGTKSYLFAGGDRAGGRYDVWSGSDGGQIFFGKEQDVQAVQLDARLDLKPFVIYGNAGYYKDSDANGTVTDAAGKMQDAGDPVDEWTHYMVTGRYDVTDWFYLAGRYSTARASKIYDLEVDGKVNRIQLGGGFRLYEGVVMKLEYVKQTTSGFNQGYTNGGADLGLNPTFDGFTFETAVKL